MTTDEKFKHEEEGFKFLSDALYKFMRGDKYAVSFCIDLLRVIHIWDDLHDGDYHRSRIEINWAFTQALLGFTTNPFFMANLNDLRPLIMSAILKWQDSNHLELPDTSEHDKHMAYMLRAGIYEIFNYCAYLTGGKQWADQVGPDMRRLYGEQLESFLEECKHA